MPLPLIAILLVGAFLRFHTLTEDVRFHPDEALFATFARNAAVHGDWMLDGALDKTPLSIYAAALSMHLTGVSVNEKNVLDLGIRQGEFAARLPNVFAGIVLIAVIYQLGCSLFDRAAGTFAALLIALSPQMIAFNATAFTDTLMLLFMVAALLMAARNRPAWAGLWLGLAVWSKQQGVFYLPLVLWFLVYSVNFSYRGGEPSARPYTTFVLVRGLQFFVAFVVPILLLFLWDALREGTSLFALAAVNNNPERFFVRPDELFPRLSTWLTYTLTFFGAWWMTLIFTLAAIYGVFRAKNFILPLYVVGYLAVHTLIAFNTYDRYLLPIIPLMTVLAAQGLSALSPQPSALLLTAFILLLTLPPLRFPTDTRARDSEIIMLAHRLNAKPLGAIIYDHWLGWEMGYYIGAWSDKRRVYYPEPKIQAEDALLNPDSAPRYFIAPVEEDVSEWLNALEAKQFQIVLEFENTRYRVYRVTPPIRTSAGVLTSESTWQGQE